MGSVGAGKVILITGGNSGVGYEACKIFLEAEKPYRVLCAARSNEKASTAVKSIQSECPKAKNTIEPITVDVNDDASIKKAVAQVEKDIGHLDVLINNAGATFDMEWVNGKMGLRDTFNKAYDTNVTGAHITAYEFMPLLLKSSEPRLLFVAGLSMMTVVNEGPYFPTPELDAGWPKKIGFETIAYRCSKTALNMLMMDWNHKLKNDGVKVFAVGPGFLATNLGNMKDQVAEMGGGHPSEGGIIYKKVVEGERDHQVGKVIDKDGLTAL